MEYISFDTETFLIGPKQLAPRLVCFTSAIDGQEPVLIPNADPDLHDYIETIFDDENAIKVLHNAAYDCCVIISMFPDLFPLIFHELVEGRVHDTVIREKLINLVAHGKVKEINGPDGVKIDLRYRLSDLVLSHLGIDISGDKEGDDIWRLNYHKLDGVPLDKWPKEAVDYALGDASYTLAVHGAQEQLREEAIASIDVDPFKVQEFRVYVDFCLRLSSCWGVAIDPVEKEKAKAHVQELMHLDNLQLLIEHKIIKPATPPKPYKNGAKEPDGTPKMTKGSKEKVNKNVLKEYIIANSDDKKFDLKYTAASDKYPEGSLSVDSDWLEDNWHKDPVIEEYRYRQDVQKLITTEIPRLEWPPHSGITASCVHPNYDVLKETGRVSSYGNSKKNKNPIYPAVNIQNVDPRIRACYVPRPGYVFCSNDHSGMELGTLAQTCLNLFGESVLADLINSGGDPHAFLGAQLAYNLDTTFRGECDKDGIDTKQQIYETFLLCNDASEPELKSFYDHYRKFAKPTGLGFPGGLGAETFCAYAKGTFGVEVDIPTAENLKKIWLDTYPEMPMYFDHITGDCPDPYNDGHYCYTSPMGMYRANCSYCAASNGLGLQTPSAEGALLGFANVMRACYDWTEGSILYPDNKGAKVRPIAFVHDEIISELREDDQMHEHAHEIGRIMVEAMKVITPDVTPKAEPALMRRWNKGAEPVFDANGRLTIWTPKEAA